MRRRGNRQMALAAEHSRGRVHPDPAGAGQINLGPGVQIGKILLGAFRPVHRLDIGAQTASGPWLHPDQIADRLPQRCIETDQKINDADGALGKPAL